MKQSEMQKLMCDTIYESAKEFFDDPNKRLNMLDVAVLVVPELLEAMEDAGMSPPTYTGLMRDGRKYIQGVHCGYDTMFINKWEPEDEE